MIIVSNINKIIEFINGNQIKIDKSTYFTVIAAQLTIYGIFLTFVQFIANIDSEGKNIITHYLGTNINSFYINKNLKLSKIIKSKIFLATLILSFLIKPILVVFNLTFDERIHSLLIFVWYSLAIIYMILFACVFVGCAKLTMEIKRIGENSKYNLVLDEIEGNFIKESDKLLRKELEVYKLDQILILVKELYKKDNRSDLLTRYDKLTKRLLQKYYDKKEYEIKLIVEKNFCGKNQERFDYNFGLELRILDGIIKDTLKREELDDEYIKSIFRIRMKILNKGLERKIISEIKDGKSGKDIKEEDKEKIWGIYESILTNRKYMNLNKELISMLYSDRPSVSEEIKEIIQFENRKEISKLLVKGFELVCYDKMSETEFIEIFRRILFDEEFKEILTKKVSELYSENYISSNTENIMKILTEYQKAYILTYLIIYHSVYHHRKEWNYFNITQLRRLLPQKDDLITVLDENRDYIISKFKNSIIEHRFHDDMISVLIDYLKERMSQELIIKADTSEIINTFYLFVFKVGVLKQEIYYQEYDFSNNKSLRVRLLKFLSRHSELFGYDKFQTFLYIFQNNAFSDEKDIDYEIENDLSCLILANITITKDLITKWRKEGKNLWTSVVKYLLIKTAELNRYNDIEDEKWIIKKVYKDFVSSNKSIDMYIGDIANIYEKYHLSLSYIQKENMNRFINNSLFEIMKYDRQEV